MDAAATLLAFMFFGFITIVLLVIAVKTIRIVPQATVMLVERLGKFHQPNHFDRIQGRCGADDRAYATAKTIWRSRWRR